MAQCGSTWTISAWPFSKSIKNRVAPNSEALAAHAADVAGALQMLFMLLFCILCDAADAGNADAADAAADAAHMPQQHGLQHFRNFRG